MFKLALAFTLFFALCAAYESFSGSYASAVSGKINSMAMNNPILLNMYIAQMPFMMWICFWDNFFGPDQTYERCSLTFLQMTLGLWKTA